MKALIASDSHGVQDRIFDLLREEKYDAFFFCGDGEGLENRLLSEAGVPPVTALVKGNNDWGSLLASEALISFGSRRIFMTHGHRYRLYAGYGLLLQEARKNECEICLFGHTHRPLIQTAEGVLLINPGSITLPRQENGAATYAVMETRNNGEVSVHIFDAETKNELE